jgi:hypothetical protein
MRNEPAPGQFRGVSWQTIYRVPISNRLFSLASWLVQPIVDIFVQNEAEAAVLGMCLAVSR